MHVYTCSKIARARAVCTARFVPIQWSCYAVGSCVWKCSEGHGNFLFFSYAKDFTGKEAGGSGGALCAVRVRELSQRVDLRVTCEMRGMRSEVVGLVNFGGKTDSEVN